MVAAAHGRIVRSGLLLWVAVIAGGAAAPQDALDVGVAVVDHTGRPVPGLPPETFEVSVDGHPGKVVSAEFMEPKDGRVFVLAIDTASFTTAESTGVVVTAQGFVDRLQPADKVGVFTYPEPGTHLNPTGDRVEIRHAIETLVADQDTGRTDLISRTADGLGGVASALSDVQGRKIVVLVCGGGQARPATALPPNTPELLARLGRATAGSNAVVYTLLLGSKFLELTIPHKIDRSNAGAAAAPPRDDSGPEAWLAQVSGQAGGALIKIGGFTPAPAFDRILLETSGYYRLRVEGSPSDRAGGLHAIQLKTRRDGAIARGPGWVFAGGGNSPAPEPAPPSPEPGPAAVEDGAGLAPLAPASVAAVAVPLEAIEHDYEVGEYDAVRDRLAGTADLPKWIRGLRASPRPWPALPRRAAVFAIEVAAVALATDSQSSVDEAATLLLQHAKLVQGAAGSDGFECGWYWAGLMLFENGYPQAAGAFLQRALQRCPDQPRLVLADAVLTDQRAPVLASATRSGAAAAAEAAAHQAAIDRYEAARRFPEIELEARVREAWLLFRMRRLDEALKLTEDLRPPAEPVFPAGAQDSANTQASYVQYAGYFVRARALREQREFDRAAEAYEQAIDLWPQAQTARVALMTLRAVQGRRTEAEALASAIERTPESLDPWWAFVQGDRPLYPSIIGRLREIAR